MKVARLVIAGVVGGAVAIGIIRAAGWAVGTDASLSAVLGAAVTGESGARAWTVGCAVQLGTAAIAALVYGGIFEWVTCRAGAAIGSAVAVPHVVIAGLVVGFLPGARMVEAGVLPPGAFFEYRGWIVLAAFIAAHLAFGVIVGVAYDGVPAGTPRGGRVWHETGLVGSRRGHD
jgi:hypothetical protein